MSNRALAVAAALNAAIPEAVVSTGAYTTSAEFVDIAHGPMIVVADGLAQGFTLTVYAGYDDIDRLTKEVFHASAHIACALGDAEMPSELRLAFEEGETLIDADGFHIGERFHFTTIEHSAAAA